MRVAVIGAGVIGAAVAREFARRECGIVVYEACRPGCGSSATTFGWVNSHGKAPRSYHDLNAAGIAAHRELLACGGPGPAWFFPTGALEWASTPEHEGGLVALVGWLREWGYPASQLGARQAVELEPDLRLPHDPVSIFYFPEEGYVIPSLLIARLLGEARELGCELRSPARVADLSSSPSGALVHLADGSVEHADVAVCCAGRWTGSLMANAGHQVPLVETDVAGSPAVGYLAYTSPVPARCARVVLTSGLGLRPDGGGRLVLQALDLDSSADPAVPQPPDGPVAREMRSRLAGVLAGGEHALIDAVVVGKRALPVDGKTVAGFVDERRRLYVVVTHSGITLAPLLGHLVAEEVAGGDPQPQLADFRPGRF